MRSVSGSIRVSVAPTVLATQIEPAPLTTLPGSPSNGIRSTASVDRGSIRDTAPDPGTAAQTEPEPLPTAATAPATRIAPTTLPDCVLMATRPFALPSVAVTA